MVPSNQHDSNSYLLGHDSRETSRLSRRLPAIDRGLLWIMSELGSIEGSRIAEIGCGPRGALHVLSNFVGSSGSVVGIEPDPRFVVEARGLVARRRLSNVSVVAGDVRSAGLSPGSFDLVYAERVIANLIDAEQVVRDMIALAAPGGTVALIEPDICTQDCDPAHPSFQSLMAAYEAESLQSHRWGPRGRRLPGLLRACGLVNVIAAGHVDVFTPGSGERFNFVERTEGAREALCRSRVISAEELDSHLLALHSHLADPNVTVYSTLYVAAMGRRPKEVNSVRRDN